MDDDVTELADSLGGEAPPAVWEATTAVWQAGCKDCEAERAMPVQAKSRTGRPPRGKQASHKMDVTFEYSGGWAQRKLDRGQSRSDRCKRHQRAHQQSIQALAVPYIDLRVIGEVPRGQNPTGPLGGLGRLPGLHKERKEPVSLDRFGFGMTDSDILEIINGLAEKRVAVIEAGTGTGKSTFMPFRLMNPPKDALLRLSAFGPIVVTEPRTAAATGVARFVGEELCFGHDSRTCGDHIGPGFPVGYQVKGDKNWDGACDLIYVTDGTMINWVREGRLSKIGTVIIDEAHERSENIDIILAQLREKIRDHKHLRIIITSATLDKDFFVAYFGGPDHVFHHCVPAQKSFGYGVPFFVGATIDDAVISDGVTIGPSGNVDTDTPPLSFPGWAEWGPAEGNDPPDDLRTISSVLEQLRCVDPIPPEKWRDQMPSAVAKQVVAIAAGTKWGDILGFLPTGEAIRTAVKDIKVALMARGLDFDVYELLAATPSHVSKAAIAARTRGERRKIVISSNLAETSLTVKGVRYVVDSGLICQPEWDPDIASGSYPTKPHSQSGLRQRWGRVGRDAPGWVFPLYTAAQFLALPKNTPPGSTHINLETFYMKLISAGIDLENTALPANFMHETVSHDQDSQKYINIFNKESIRARRALSLSGALDCDGHLTGFGRELERFPGDGSQALAIMLSDQLACVHEVALALEVLCQGRLIGHREGCILRVSREWPSAWRVGAAQRHRALAIGCTDDLGVLLRVFALWQNAEDQEAWCRMWWVNEAALKNALGAAMATVETLSAAMKGEANRKILPELGGRARAVLSRAMVSQRYQRVDGNMFRRVGDIDAEEVTLGHSQLVDAGDRILAFSRFRPGASGDSTPRAAIISHTVRILGWAETDGPGSDDIGLELLLRTATHSSVDEFCLRDVRDDLSAVRASLPVGAIVDLELEDVDVPIRKIQVVDHPFALPGDDSVAGDASLRSMDPSGFDRDWDPNARPDAEATEEEAAFQILDPLDLAENDPLGVGALSTVPAKVPETSISVSLPSIYLIRTQKSESEPAVLRGMITGYKVIDDANIGLLIDPLNETAAGGDPALHADLTAWQDIDLVVREIVRDHENDYLQLDRCDGQGCFYLNTGHASGLGLDLFDEGFGHRLATGARITGKAVPCEYDPMSVTLLAAARVHIAKAPSEVLDPGSSTRFFSAEIVEPLNERGYARVLLEPQDKASGLSHTFGIHRRDLPRSLRADVGRKLLVALGPDRHELRKSLDAKLQKPLAFATMWSDFFVVKANRIRASDRDIPLHIINGLLLLEQGDEWAREVWEFYVDSLHMVVQEVRPPTFSKRLAVVPAIVSLFSQRKKDVMSDYNNTLQFAIDRGTNEMNVSGPDLMAVNAAVESIRNLADLPRITAELPPGTSKQDIGYYYRKRLEDRVNVRWVSVDGDTVTVIGNSDNAVREAVKDIRGKIDLAVGELFVPLSKTNIFIGTKGRDINILRDSTGCRASKVDGSEMWRIEGTKRSAVEEFIRLAGERRLGTTGRVISVQKLNIIEDTTKRSPSSRRDVSSPAAGLPPSVQEAARPQRTSPVVNRTSMVRPSPKAEPDAAVIAAVLVALVAIIIVIVLVFNIS